MIILAGGEHAWSGVMMGCLIIGDDEHDDAKSRRVSMGLLH